MGASVNVNKSAISRSIENTLSQSCENSTNITQSLGGIRITLKDNARCDDILIMNEAKAVSECDMSMTASILEDFKDELSNEAKAGLGLAVNKTQTENISDIKKTLESKCGNQTSIQQTIKDIEIVISGNARCDTIDMINRANATSGCVMAFLAELENGATTDNSGAASGWDPCGFLCAGFCPCIVLLVCCACCCLPSGKE